MKIILFAFFITFTLGLYSIFLDLLYMPTLKSKRAIVAIDKREKKKSQSLDVVVSSIAVNVAKFIKLSDYKHRKLQATLKSASIKLSPEAYIAKAWVKAGLTLLVIFPAFFIFPIVSPVVLFLSVAVYFKEMISADEAVRKMKEDIEYELPRFVSTLSQELKASRNVLAILESYKQNAGQSFRGELEITVADMRSGSYESALTRLESRLGSSSFSEVSRGLIGVLRGDDGVVYFQMLAHDLKQLELQRLKKIAMKQPGKVRKYSFLMLFCFLMMYLSVILVEIITTMSKMF